MTRKDLLNEPDEFVSRAGTIFVWIKEHPANAAAIALVAIGLIASAFALMYWKTSRDQDAMNAFLKATDDYELTLKVTRDYAGTRADKLARLRLSRMAYEKGDTKKAMSLAEEFLDEWGGMDTFHWQAVLIEADCLKALNQPDRALALAETCISGAGGVLKDHALFLKGSILLSGGKTAEARKAFEAVSENYRDLARSALSSHEDRPETGAAPTQ
jgi:hypothetical protein